MKKAFNISEFKNKAIHIIGVTGSEGSAILRFLVKEKFTDITVHDYTSFTSLEKSFKLWHKGLPVEKRNDAYKLFVEDIRSVRNSFETDYLKGIESADVIFAPQSWRLYTNQNAKLFEAFWKGIPFYSLTSLYLDLSKANVIAVTGTVGKGSVSHLIFNILKENGKTVYYGGNDTWSIQSLEHIYEMSSDSYLILEISHRQMQEGIQKAPDIAVFTNIYPNHLDEISWEEYKKLKYSIFYLQTSSQIAVLNKDFTELVELSKQVSSNIVFFSTKNIELNTKYVQKVFRYFMNNKSEHIFENIIAVSSVMEVLNIPVAQTIEKISKLKPPSARIQKIAHKGGVSWYDDIKSTTPWATLGLIEKLGNKTILIMGGKTKGIDYKEPILNIRKGVTELIILESELSREVKTYLESNSYMVVTTLHEALSLALKDAKQGYSVAVSPGAAYFYSEFIKGRESIRQILTSLLQLEKE